MIESLTYGTWVLDFSTETDTSPTITRHLDRDGKSNQGTTSVYINDFNTS